MDWEERERYRAEMIEQRHELAAILRRHVAQGGRRARRQLTSILSLTARISRDPADHEALHAWRQELRDLELADLAAGPVPPEPQAPRRPRQPGHSRRPRR